MIGRDSREDIDAYGLWPWACGIAFCSLLIWMMFALASSI